MNVKYYNRDCMEAMASMEDNKFDLAIVDPPYGLAEAGAHTHISGTRKLYSDDMASWDVRPSQEYFDEVRRVSKNQIIFGMNYFMDLLPPSRCFIVWDTKQRGLSFSQSELAWASFEEMCKVVRLSNTQPERIHRCQKPVALYEWLLDNYAKPGDKILDTHLGSGSIGLACHNQGFYFEGYEVNRLYYNSAVDRLLEHQQQLKLFV